MTQDHSADSRATMPYAEPATPDATVQEIVQLLGLAAGEEQAWSRLECCVADLNRIAAARAALAGCTRTELAEAQAWISRPVATGSAPMLPVAEGGEPS